MLSTYTVTLNGATKEEATIDEQMLLGAGRVGLRQASQLIWSNVTSIPAETSLWLNKLGKKRYELSNHLGNVNAVITDRKVVNTGYTMLAHEDYATSTITWSYSSSCGAPAFTVSGGKLTVTNGNCTMFIARTHAAVAGTVYTFSVDVVDHSAIAGFSIELQAGPSSTGPFSLIVPAFTNVANGRFSYTFTVPSGMTHVRYGFKKLTTETGMGFTIDNLDLGTAVARYAAVPLQKMDYYPFGMEMTGGIELGSIPASVTGSGTIVEERVVYTSHFRTVTNGDGDLQLSPGSATSSTDNSANGVQMVLPGEYIEFTASPDPIATNRTFVGLSYVDGGFLQTSINYSWYIYPTGSSYVFESGTQMYANHTAYVPGTTTWRIARTGGNIVYYKNGVAVRTVADVNPTQPMVIDITLWNTGTVDKARVYNLKVGKLQFVVATYAIGDYVPYVHSDYRFGYNGMEKDPEMKGDGNSYTTEFRQYDPRLGRWMSLDPLMMEFPDMSPYTAFDNNPVIFTDPQGLAAEGGPLSAQAMKAISAVAAASSKLGGDIYRELEGVTIIGGRPISKDGHVRERNLGSQPSDRTGNQVSQIKTLEDYKQEEVAAAQDFARRNQASIGQLENNPAYPMARQIGKDYEGVIEFVPGVTIAKKLNSGEEWSTGEVLVEAASILPIGRLVSKSGKIVKKVATADDVARTVVRQADNVVTAGKNFKDHFIRHKGILEDFLGKKYSKYKTHGEEFLDDIGKLISNGNVVFVGQGTLKKGMAAMNIYRGNGMTVVTTASGEFVTILKQGQGMDLGIQLVP